jgi:autotransporter-associated beta strand protein
MFVGLNTGTGTYNLTGDGSLAVGKLWIGGQVYGENGTGTVSINTTGTVQANSTDDFSGWGQYQTSLSVGWGSFPSGPANGTLNMIQGTINVPNRAIYVGAWGSTGTVNQSGGTINANGLELGRWFSTLATANITGGTLNSAYVNLARSGNGGDISHAVLNVSGSGVLNSEGDMVVAVGGASSGYGRVNIGTGGTVNVATTTERWLIVNQWDTAPGTLTVNGGVLNLNAGTDLRFSTSNSTGPGVVNVSSGTITGGAGSVIDLNNNVATAPNNQFNLDGGTVTIGQIVTVNNGGTAAFNFNGGTLRAAGTSATFLDLGGATQSAQVQVGGAVIDSNGFDITIPEALVSGSAAGGGLTKNGLGTLTLGGVNTYTGPTVVSAGSLMVAGQLANTSGVTVAGGASIGGAGSMAGNLSFGNGGQLVFNPSNPLVVSGSVTFASASTFGIDDILGVSSSTPDGVYTLISGNVDTTGLANFGAPNAYDLGGGKSAYFQAGSLQMVVVPEPSNCIMVASAIGVGMLFRRRKGWGR